jgi:ADP-ribosylglycohydrolase
MDGSLFHELPEPLPDEFDFKRIEGMLLGTAFGDALGATTEGMIPGERNHYYGEIRGYLPNRYANNCPLGLPSDDTQMTFWTLEQLITDNGLVPVNLADRFCREQIFGIGSAVHSFIVNYKENGCSWQEAGARSLGNGSLMRIAPVIVPYLKSPGASLWADVAIDTMITHNDYGAVAASVAFIYLLWSLLGMKSTPDPEWWAETFCSRAEELEGESRYRPRHGRIIYEGPLWRFTREMVRRALKAKMSIVSACNWWASGAYLLETVPSVLYILARHAADPEEAIIRAVNDTKDNDTIAAIVGAAVGALHGIDAIPSRWRDGLIGRTGESDDGRIYELIAMAKERFWTG